MHLFSFLRRLLLLLSCPSSAHYVAGAPSLPPPLTPEEEKTLLARMMAGDRAARDDLITHNLRLVVYLAKKYENTGVPAEDMISSAPSGSSRRSTPSRRSGTSSWPPTPAAASATKF